MNTEHLINKRDIDLELSFKETLWESLTRVGVRLDFRLAHDHLSKTG